MVEVLEVLADLDQLLRLDRQVAPLGVEQPARLLVVEDVLVARLGVAAGVEVIRLENTPRAES